MKHRQPSSAGTGVAPALPLIALALVALSGCLAPGARFARTAEHDPRAAEAQAAKWLERHGEADPNREAVLDAQGEAAFMIADDLDSVPGWQRFQADYSQPRRLVGIAARREASAAFRDVASSTDTVGAYRTWRRDYPDGIELPEARGREVELAFIGATEGDGIEGIQRFQAEYDDWPEAARRLSDAREIEMDRTFAVTKAEGSTPALRDWLTRYGDWAEKPGVRAEAHALADRAIATDAVGALLVGSWERAALLSWLDDSEALPAAGAVASERVDELWSRAELSDSTEGWWVLSRLLTADPRGGEASARARALGWEAVKEDPSRGLHFVQMFPSDAQAWEAEGAWIEARERGAPRARWASVQRRRALPGGDVELTVDVVDCQRQRLAGLTRESFTLYDGDTVVPLTAFSSLEQDRPLSLSVAIDLSGSMATERRAVDVAVERFAETLRFRNRAVSVGLIGFSDGVIANHAPTPRVRDFRGWISALPENVGGGGAEDTSGALVEASEQLQRTPGEHVVVTLSDEGLQVNLRGRQALDLTETKCDAARAVGGCLGWCGQDLSCVRTCLADGPVAFSTSLSRCAERGSEQYCLSRGIGEADAELTRCSRIVDHPELPLVLARRLAVVGARTFFLAVAGAKTEFESIAFSNGGRVLEVPNDTSDPAPYERALLDIADQLSKQYVITYKPSSPSVLEMRVRPDWRWSAADLPSDAEGGRESLTPDHEDPAVLTVEEDGSVVRSFDGSSWRAVLPPDHGRRELVLAGLGQPAVCTGGETGIFCSTDLGRSWFSIAPAMEGGAGVTLLGSPEGLYARVGERSLGLLRVLSRDLPASALYFATKSDTFEAALEPFVRELGGRLARDPSLRLRVEGHADARGSDAYNDDLALRRARRVAAAVVEAGAAIEQITVESFGERRPVRNGSSQADYSRNRRVELILLETPRAAAETTCRSPL